MTIDVTNLKERYKKHYVTDAQLDRYIYIYIYLGVITEEEAQQIRADSAR